MRPEELEDLARLRRGDLSVTEVRMAVGCTSLGSFRARDGAVRDPAGNLVRIDQVPED